MAEKKFRRKKIPGTTLYNYQPQRNLRTEEVSAYRRLIFTSIIILLFAGFLYFWGIQIVATIASLWGNFMPTPAPSKLEDHLGFIGKPKLDPLPPAINNLSSLNISGWTNAGMEVKILVNDQEVASVISDASGRFTASDIPLTEGINKISAYSTSSPGQKSELTQTQIVNFDKIPPSLEIQKPEEGAEFTGEEVWLTIIGETEPKAKVTVNNHQAIVDLEGKFRFQYRLNSGENPLQIKAEDEAGNQTVIERTVLYLSTEDSSRISPNLSPNPS